MCYITGLRLSCNMHSAPFICPLIHSAADIISSLLLLLLIRLQKRVSVLHFLLKFVNSFWLLPCCCVALTHIILALSSSSSCVRVNINISHDSACLLNRKREEEAEAGRRRSWGNNLWTGEYVDQSNARNCWNSNANYSRQTLYILELFKYLCGDCTLYAAGQDTRNMNMYV